jgi:DNA polymerase-1
LLDREALNHIQNEYINTPVQSAASDLTMFSLMEIHRQLREKGLDSAVISTVHDSIILEVAEAELAEVVNIGKTVMATLPGQLLPECSVPFAADAEWGVRWGNLEPWKED